MPNEILPIENEAGEIALQYYQPVQKYVEINSGGYVFIVRADISLAWVKQSDVGAVMAVRAGCNCGGNRSSAFYYANESSVRRWTNGGGA